MARLFLTLYIALISSIFGLFYAIDYLSSRHFAHGQVDDVSRSVSAYQELLVRLYDGAGLAAMEEGMMSSLKHEGADVYKIEDRATLPQRVLALDAGQIDFYVLGEDDFKAYFKAPDGVTYYGFRKDPSAPRWRVKSLLDNLYLSGFFLITALVLGGWIYLLQRKLKLLENSANRLAEGDFSARVPQSAKHSVGSLNEAFNKMAERIEQLIASHKRLTNAVAHELRTPIFRLRCQAELLEHGIERSEHEAYIKGIDQDLTELDQLVAEMLDCARMVRSEGSFELREHSFKTWLQQHSDTLKRSCAKALTIHTGPDVRLRFDEAQVIRALSNIVRNADKYAEQAIEISYTQCDSALEIRVDDDGLGIPSSQVERLLEPFERLDSARNRKVGGHGLGLSIVREITQQHGGQLRIETSALGGARVVISLSTEL
ncbi:MAG: ATP-binding protein [Pseudomonadales bacterium]